MKIIWTGTDSLFLVKFPKQQRWIKIFYIIALRVFARLSDIFTQEHYSCGELVEKNLKKFGMKKKIKLFKDSIQYCNIERIKHDSFNILYYCPDNKKFNKWLYGWDIFIELNNSMPEFNFIHVNGKYDLKDVYSFTDILIRPNRHDGHPRMIDECIMIGIPYIWTSENPSLEYFKDGIMNIYNKKPK